MAETTSSTTTSSPPPETSAPPPTTSSQTTSSAPPTTSTTPTTTSTTPTTTTTSTTPTSTTEQTTAQPTTSIPPVTTSAPPSNSAPQQSSTSIAIITSGNIEVTQTVIIQPSLATSPAASQSSDPSPGFFANKGAVAGTFTAVGLIALAGIGFLIFTLLRKRRARKFDREVDEAAFEAASAPAPAFLDDEDDAYTQHNQGIQPNYTGRSGPQSITTSNGGGGYYSDASHGTYAQQPMSPESYGMSEINPHHSVGPGQLFNPGDAGGYGAAAGAAGIGVTRTRSMMANQQPQHDQGYGLDTGNAPYAAFAGPGYGNDNNRQSTQPNDNPYAAAGVQRGTSRGSSTGGFNPYTSPTHNEPVPPMPANLARSSSNSTSLVNPYDSRESSPPPPLPTSSPLANPHEQDAVPRNRVFSGGDFGGGSTPEYGHAPIHAPQMAEQGRWSDYQDDASPGTEEGGPMSRRDHDDDESDEEEEDRPKVFKVANE